MAKVIVEIDGVRHRFVKDKQDFDCNKDCSLRDYCLMWKDIICNSFGEGYHFEKEEPFKKAKVAYERGC